MSRRPQYVPATSVLQVLDLGLDFRSYLSQTDSEGVPMLGNIISYDASIVADTFEPTVGLLVTVLQLYATSDQNSTATTWLTTYDTLQSVYIDQQEVGSVNDGVKYAREGRDLVKSEIARRLPSDKRAIYTRLLNLLDMQCGIKGQQAPSQRKQQRDPKGAFCNLHLSDHKCYQDFACNQLHLHESGPVKHRLMFFQRLAEILLDQRHPREEVLHRVKDSIFFARYGNKVTVRYRDFWIPFFKTVYTAGRLAQAFREEKYSCNNPRCTNENCRGIHAQDNRSQPSKALDIQDPEGVKAEIAAEAEHVLSTVEHKGNSTTEAPPTPLSLSSSDPWKNASVIREYVRQTGNTTTEADEGLLRTLQEANCSASITSSDTTPVEDFNFVFGSSASSSVSDRPYA